MIDLTSFEGVTKIKETFEEHLKKWDEYELLSEYKDDVTLIRFKHKSCGYEFEATPYEFMNKLSKCPKCLSKKLNIKSDKVKRVRKKAHDKFLEFLKTLNDFELVSEYVNNYTKVKIKHLTCGNEFEVMPKNFHKHTYCPCKNSFDRINKERRKKGLDSLKEFCEQEGYEYISPTYKNRFTVGKFKHLKCGTEFETKPVDFMKKCKANMIACTNPKCKYEKKYFGEV